MAKFIVLTVIIILLALAQIAIFPKVAIFGARPDLILVAIIIWSLLTADYQESWFLALGGGLLLDFNSGLPFGVITLSLFLTVFLITRLATDIFHGINILAVIITVTVATFIFDTLLIGFTYIFNTIHLGSYSVGFSSITYETLPSILYNLIAAAGLFYVLHLVYVWLEQREKRIKLLQL